MNIEKITPSLLLSENSANNKDEAIKAELRESILSFFEKKGANTEVLKKYWHFLEESREYSQQDKYGNKEKISNIDEANEYVENLIKNGIKPIISIPREYIEAVKCNGGIGAQETDIKNFKAIAGIIGDMPYKAGSNDRLFYEVDCSYEDISPRLTGGKGYFNGVVVWKKEFIPIESMHEIEKNSLFEEAA